MRPPSLARVSLALLVGVALLATGGCRNRLGSAGEGRDVCCAPAVEPSPCAADQPVASRVMPGDTLHGHLAAGEGCQCFYFDGVEYGLLDYEVVTDCAGGTIPTVSIEGPDGKDLGLEEGPAKSAGIVLHKSGTYRVTVCKKACEDEVYYAFKYDLRLLAPEDKSVSLTPCAKQTLSFLASKGSRCVVTIAPTHACNVVPRILAVKDPAGGRALACEAQLDGAPTPMIRPDRANAAHLDFIAAKPGRYTVIYSAAPDTEGDATTHVQVFPPKERHLELYHDGRPCPEGFTTSG